jgi:hypothetical protein
LFLAHEWPSVFTCFLYAFQEDAGENLLLPEAENGQVAQEQPVVEEVKPPPPPAVKFGWITGVLVWISQNL